MLNSNFGGGIPGYMGESGVKATSPTDPHLSDPHAAANDLWAWSENKILTVGPAQPDEMPQICFSKTDEMPEICV